MCMARVLRKEGRGGCEAAAGSAHLLKSWLCTMARLHGSLASHMLSHTRRRLSMHVVRILQPARCRPVHFRAARSGGVERSHVAHQEALAAGPAAPVISTYRVPRFNGEMSAKMPLLRLK